MPRPTLILLLTSLLCSVFLHLSPVFAESLSVSLQVGSTEVSFSGYTSPNSQVLVKEGTSVIGTTTSDNLGNWTKVITVAIPDTPHTYTLTAIDTSARTTTPLSYNLNVAGNTTTTLDNIVLPPTFAINNHTALGSAYPLATLTLSSSNGQTTSTTADSSGNWEIDLHSLAFTSSVSLQVTATVGSYLSINTASLAYHPLASAPSPTSESPAPSASTTPSPTTVSTPSFFPSPTPFFIPVYDADGNGRLSLDELFEIVKNWLTQYLPCDLNRDNVCNLVDLSVLLYYVER